MDDHTKKSGGRFDYTFKQEQLVKLVRYLFYFLQITTNWNEESSIIVPVIRVIVINILRIKIT